METTNGIKSPPATPSKVVNFSSNKESGKTREKYLTAKYGSHQMALIRKRLKVEMWMYDKLQELCKIQTEHEVEIDLDEVLDIDDDMERRVFVQKILIDSNSSPEIINKFVDDLLEKAKTL